MLAGSSLDPNLALIAKPAQQNAEATEYQNHFCLRVFTPEFLPLGNLRLQTADRELSVLSALWKLCQTTLHRTVLVADLGAAAAGGVKAGLNRLAGSGMAVLEAY